MNHNSFRIILTPQIPIRFQLNYQIDFLFKTIAGLMAMIEIFLIQNTKKEINKQNTDRRKETKKKERMIKGTKLNSRIEQNLYDTLTMNQK